MPLCDICHDPTSTSDLNLMPGGGAVCDEHLLVKVEVKHSTTRYYGIPYTYLAGDQVRKDRMIPAYVWRGKRAGLKAYTQHRQHWSIHPDLVVRVLHEYQPMKEAA